MRRLLLSISLMFFSLASYSDTAEQLCMAGGYYSGSQDMFLSGLAAHVLNQRNQLSTPSCGALWREASKVGENFSKTGKTNQQDQEIIQEAGRFSKKVYDSIVINSGI